MGKFNEMKIFDIKNTELDGMPIDHNLKEIDVSKITDGIGFDTESKKHLTEITLAVIGLSLVLLVCLTVFVTWLVMRNKKASPIFSVTLPNNGTKPSQNISSQITPPQSTSSQNIPFQIVAPQTEISVDELISGFKNMDKTTNTWEPTIKLLTTKQFAHYVKTSSISYIGTLEMLKLIGILYLSKQ